MIPETLTATGIHPRADSPASLICSPCCNVHRRCQRTPHRPAPASGLSYKDCPQDAHIHPPGPEEQPIFEDGSFRTCPSEYGRSEYDPFRMSCLDDNRYLCCRADPLIGDIRDVLTP